MSVEISQEFKNLIKDFINDISITFPEYKNQLETYDLENNEDLQKLFDYCSKIYPERFFDILYKNEEMFNDPSRNTMFLPNIEFKVIWNENISHNTRQTIWKYLQLILFSISSSINGLDSFGDTAKLFEAINEEDFKQKLEETINSMSDMFDFSNNGMNDISNLNQEDLPNPDDIHNHINKLLDGKLGRLAAEIAEETAKDLDLDLSNNSNVNQVFESLFKNPGKLMKMVKNVGSKLDEKLKSGEIKESEIMKEASELMSKMNNMEGMKNMNKLFTQMGIPGMGGKNKINVNAMQSQLKQNMKNSKQKERMLRKLEERRLERELKQAQEKLRQESMSNLENKEFTHTKYKNNENEVIEKSKRKRNNKNKKKKKKKVKNKK
ncbi:MAG: hypothetical protein CBB97_00745 [Candidatus Endolissoclinum sp. TMED37]|nr:MAG: hypothetical protein CBB97_00745 [Candidatus Endolissoclinum sp. TMED37]